MESRRKGKRRSVRQEHDEWGRPYVYIAEYKEGSLSSGMGVFTNLKAAVFYVIFGIGGRVDWDTFPDPNRSYPYEERNGSKMNLTPVFRVQRMGEFGQPIEGTVTRIAAMKEWMPEQDRTLFNRVIGAARRVKYA